MEFRNHTKFIPESIYDVIFFISPFSKFFSGLRRIKVALAGSLPISSLNKLNFSNLNPALDNELKNLLDPLGSSESKPLSPWPSIKYKFEIFTFVSLLMVFRKLDSVNSFIFAD